MLQYGYLTKKQDGHRIQEPYTMRLVETQEMDKVCRLQQTVYDALPNKNLLYMDSEADMLDALYSGGKILGVFTAEEALIAYRYISLPGDSAENLGRDIWLPSRELERVVHLETTVVHPDYRGNKLQKRTLDKVFELIEPMDVSHVMCTISPFNVYSLKNIMSGGLRIKALKKKYGDAEGGNGMWRFILHRDLKSEQLMRAMDSKAVRMEALETQQALIHEGYVGHTLLPAHRVIQYMLPRA